MVDEVSTLKRQLDGDIVVNSSTELVQALMEVYLVDVMRLIIHPVVLGASDAFGETSAANLCALVDGRTVGDSLSFDAGRWGEPGGRGSTITESPDLPFTTVVSSVAVWAERGVMFTTSGPRVRRGEAGACGDRRAGGLVGGRAKRRHC